MCPNKMLLMTMKNNESADLWDLKTLRHVDCMWDSTSKHCYGFGHDEGDESKIYSYRLIHNTLIYKSDWQND